MRVLQYAAIAAVIILMIAGRVLVGGFREDARAREEFARGNMTEAITAYDRSLHWYLPGSPTVNRAIEGLKGIAASAEAKEDIETALRAWRVLRSGLYASRWLVIPRPDVIDTADMEIARLVSSKVPEADRASEYDREMKILKKPVGPKTGWSIAAIICFFAWTLGIIAFIFKSFGPEDEFHRRPALVIGLLTLTAYALWMFSLASA